jgi:hypothetical protein
MGCKYWKVDVPVNFKKFFPPGGGAEFSTIINP